MDEDDLSEDQSPESPNENARALELNEALGAARVDNAVDAGVARDEDAEADEDEDADEDTDASDEETQTDPTAADKLADAAKWVGPSGWIFNKIVYPFLKFITGMQ